MSKYGFNIKGFFTFVPTMFRSKLETLLGILLRPLEYLHSLFSIFKDNTIKRLEYSGQIFSLQKAIRNFCRHNGCMIVDGEYFKDFFVSYDSNGRLANYQVDVPYDGIDEHQVKVRYSQSLEYDFIVRIPYQLEGIIDEVGLRTLIDSYKIAGKKYEIVYY